ncbi:hypothetical protein [Clostridium cuniculi]|uniref:hypothetical protein n=1 Tax=Clostridium cuniculi TaxID=2548455 RepID=UPI0010562E01|nr:hypothetical protein [Clostridium cuniculi]
MLFENLKPIRVLSEDEVKMELYRLRQKQILGVTAIGTGTLATFKLLKYISPIFDSYIYGFRGKSVNTYLKLSNKLNQSISFPYVTSVNVLHITICVSIFLFILYLVAFIKYKKNNTLTIKDVLLTISPILLWVAMEVIF